MAQSAQTYISPSISFLSLQSSEICCFLFNHTKTGAGANDYCSLLIHATIILIVKELWKNAHCDFSDVFFHPTNDPKCRDFSFAAINASASLTFKKLEAACA